MNSLLLLTIIGVACILIITPIIVYQFVRQEQALNNIEKMLNPEPKRGTLFEQLYDSYQECLDEWNKPQNMEILKNTSPTSTPKEHCDIMSGM